MQRPSSLPEAAVMIVVSGALGCEKVLLTKRSAHLREHAGEVALPGGKRDEGDQTLYCTAARECFEEVGLAPCALRRHATLPAHQTRNGSAVVPFVAHLEEDLGLRLNPDEIESAFWAPLALFAEDQRTRTHIFKLREFEYWAPVYHFNGYEIWGFTARVLVSFVNQCYGKSLARAHPSAPEVQYS